MDRKADQIEEEIPRLCGSGKILPDHAGPGGGCDLSPFQVGSNNKDKYLGDEETWDYVQNMMRDILHHIGIEFYGRRRRSGLLRTEAGYPGKERVRQGRYHDHHQLDMFLAERFDMTYIDANGEKKRPYIIHRTSMGCYERTLAWLIEKYWHNHSADCSHNESLKSALAHFHNTAYTPELFQELMHSASRNARKSPIQNAVRGT